MDIAELITAAKQGSSAAQKNLFDKLSGRMVVVCRRYVKNKEDAEEMMLDGFFKFFKTLGTFNCQGEDALQAWLKKIMINQCLMFLRKRNVFTIVTEAVAAEIPLEEEALNNLSGR